MNTKLVESLVQIIQSLTPEEQALLSSKLKFKNNWQEEYQKLLQLRDRAFRRLNGGSTLLFLSLVRNEKL